MEGKGLVFRYRGEMYFYREYKDGTSDVFPLMTSGVLGMFYFDWDRPVLSPLYTPPISEWIPCPKYKLGWMDLSYPKSQYICISIVLYHEEYVLDYYKKRMLLTIEESFAYACRHAVSTDKTIVLDGVGSIYKSNGGIQIERQPQSIWRLVE